MSYLDADAVEVRESEWIKIGKTAWPQSVTYGKKRPGDSDLTFHTATGALVKSGERVYVEGCDNWRLNLSEFEVCKRRSVNHCCLLKSTRRWMESRCCLVTKVTCSTEVRKLRRKSKHGLRELRDSQYRGCTVAFKENNVYNIYMKPRGNKTDAMPLSGDSESGGCRPGPNL